MDIAKYNKISNFCKANLFKKFHARHLEDCIQYVAMKDWEYQGRQNWKHALINYCRENGIHNERGKLGAKTIENSLSIDMPSPSNMESDNSYFLLDQESSSRSDYDSQLIHHDDTKRGLLEEFLSPLSLSNEVIRWVTKSFKVKTN